MRSRYLPRFIPLILAVLLLAACADSGDEAADTTVAPTVSEATTTTAAPTTTTAAVTTTETLPSVEVPGSGEPWDLLVLGRDDDLGVGFLETYSEQASEILGVDVIGQYAGIDEGSAWQILGGLRGEAYPDIRDLVRNAEILVMETYPERANDGDITQIDIDSKNCSYYVSAESPKPPAPTTPVYWQPYTDLLNEIYPEIRQLRNNAPTVILAPDLPNRYLARQRDAGIGAECGAWADAWSAVIRTTAEAHGAVYIPLSDVLNGPDHQIDAYEAGYTGATELHPTLWDGTPNEVGMPMVVEAIIAGGLQPTTQP